MGTGKKKIEIEKIMKETSRMVTFSKRRKGLFKKAKELESMTGSRVASVVFSPTGRPYTCGDVNFAIKQHFSTTRCRELLTSDCGDINFAIKPHFASTRCMELLTSGLNSHDSDSDSDDVVFDVSLGSKSSSTSKRNGLRCWVEGIDVEQYQNLNQLLMLKQQLEGTREKIASMEELESFEALFV
ncbi:MADS-box protein SVP-like [Solanum stenotomum]|uniref:MADS-box protein SVP-like n=1 Tax=Solanum stenotomum TaxID=172797 RepID=UPI0020D11F89|nr:MADS-box protein SVP-like [Solanum stenotomum]